MSNPQVSYIEAVKDYDTLTFTKLGETMRHGIDPPPQLIPDLIYGRGIHSIYSPGGTGKTIMALWCAVQVMRRKLHVIYCDEENGSNAIAELLQCHGATPTDVDRYIRYAEFPHLSSKDAERWERTVQGVQPALVVFDSFADMLALEGADENSSVQVTQWIKTFAEPVKQSGGAALILDHINRANSGTGARGSTAKLAKVDVAWRLDGKQFDRTTTAELTIKKDKDRMGCLPKQHTFTVGGDGKGNLIFDTGEVSNTTDPSELTGNRKFAFDVLVSEFPQGISSAGWKQVATKNERMSDRTFYRVQGYLEDNEYVQFDRENGVYLATV